MGKNYIVVMGREGIYPRFETELNSGITDMENTVKI